MIVWQIHVGMKFTRIFTDDEILKSMAKFLVRRRSINTNTVIQGQERRYREQLTRIGNAHLVQLKNKTITVDYSRRML